MAQVERSGEQQKCDQQHVQTKVQQEKRGGDEEEVINICSLQHCKVVLFIFQW